ncbi:hypothetical protein FB567DRAFT_528811 [Paraphoma chrysanthemicola]|uniref:Uncharacterized protein n=1 Tax=Paraphoma chrysanthemicola TaxID=798071 RepID=A0A8K0VX82_9PLEO|nr:hypothetical protein FB567DRAFT_528811 [Paraphoma chrysanthemicola]
MAIDRRRRASQRFDVSQTDGRVRKGRDRGRVDRNGGISDASGSRCQAHGHIVSRRTRRLCTNLENLSESIPKWRTKECRTLPNFSELRKRQKRVEERIVFHQDRITKLANELNGYVAQGINRSDHRWKKAHETLAYHRRKREWLDGRKSELAKECRHSGLSEAEAHRQAAIRRYGWDRDLEESADPSPHLISRAAVGTRPATTTPQIPTGLYIPAASDHLHGRRTQPVVVTRESFAETNQITREHIRLSRGYRPDDPFEVSLADGLTADQCILLKRISKKPQLVDHYPYAKAYLEETPNVSDDVIRLEAKAAIEEHLALAQTIPVNNLPLEMQDLHDQIAAQENLSDQAKLILLMTTFIPYGRYTTYNAIREWLHSTRGMTSDIHIASALRKGAVAFSFDEIPSYRVIGQNWRVSDYGTHTPDLDDDDRRAMLEAEGGRFDKNGRLLGGRLEFHEVEDEMKGTLVANYVRNFPYRFGGWQ